MPRVYSYALGREIDLPDPEIVPEDRYFLGLSLGAPAEYTALVIVRRRPIDDQWNKHTVRGIRRWPPSTLYAVIAADVSALTAVAPLRNSVLVVDRSSVGVGVFDAIKRAGPVASLRSIWLTTGMGATQDGLNWRISRRDLVSVVDQAFTHRRIDVPLNLGPDAELMRLEIPNFLTEKLKAGDAHTIDWRVLHNEDLVRALSVAVWCGEQRGGTFRFSGGSDE